jgi:hypothetical protein
MNSYLKQAHTKEVEKIGVSSYKQYCWISTILLGILTNIVPIYSKKSPVTFMFETTSKIEKT